MNSTAPFASALAIADSGRGPLLLASETLTGTAGDNVTLHLSADASLLADLPASETITAHIGDETMVLSLRELTRGVVVHEFADGAPVLARYEMSRSLERLPHGRVVLTQETSARVEGMRAPWVSARSIIPRSGDLVASPDCGSPIDVSANTTVCTTNVQFSQVAPADAFLAEGAEFQSDAGHAESHQITIQFSRPVSSVEMTIYDPTFPGNNFTTFDSAGAQVAFTAFPGNGQPGVTTVQSATHSGRIASITLDAAPADFVAYSMRVVFQSAGCKVNVTSMGQGQLPWALDVLDHSPTVTIKQRGCALTSVAMGLTGFGIATDPRVLNNTLKVTPGGFKGLGLNWLTDVPAGSNRTLRYEQISSDDQMKKEICAGNPAVVGVDIDSKGTPHHFVLVNQVKADSTFWITDPRHGSGVELDLKQTYPVYQYRGVIKPVNAPAIQGALTHAPTPGTLLSFAAVSGPDVLAVLVRNASITLTDNAGLSAATGGAVSVQQIPGSFAFTDMLDDDDEPFAVATEQSSTVGVPSVDSAFYTVQIVPMVSGRDSALVMLARTDGSDFPSKTFYYDGIAGTPVLFEITNTAGVVDASPLITGEVDITASCGLSHQVRNANDVDLAATYLVEETGETGAVLLPARPAGKSYSRTKLTTTTHGTLSIQYHGRVIARAPAPPGCS